MQNKLEKASVSQHCYPKSDVVKKDSKQFGQHRIRKHQQNSLLKGLHRFCLFKTRYALLLMRAPTH
jgi:hypothetical protein